MRDSERFAKWALELIDGVIQLTKSIGDFPAGNKKFKSVSYAGVLLITPCQR